MGEHGNAFGFFQMLGLDELPKPVHQRLSAKGAVVGVIRLVLAHLQWAMAERHDFPRQPADDGVDAVKLRSHQYLGQKFDPSNGKAVNGRQAVKRCSCRPIVFVTWRTVDKGWESYGLAWCRDVFDVK